MMTGENKEVLEPSWAHVQPVQATPAWASLPPFRPQGVWKQELFTFQDPAPLTHHPVIPLEARLVLWPALFSISH